ITRLKRLIIPEAVKVGGANRSRVLGNRDRPAGGGVRAAAPRPAPAEARKPRKTDDSCACKLSTQTNTESHTDLCTITVLVVEVNGFVKKEILFAKLSIPARMPPFARGGGVAKSGAACWC